MIDIRAHPIKANTPGKEQIVAAQVREGVITHEAAVAAAPEAVPLDHLIIKEVRRAAPVACILIIIIRSLAHSLSRQVLAGLSTSAHGVIASLSSFYSNQDFQLTRHLW